MPELPDLQAFSQTLSRKLVGKTVEKIHAIHAKKLNVSPQRLQADLGGAKVTSIFRDGKELHLSFDNGNILGLHLMLRGALQLFEGKYPGRFAVLELTFTDGTGLVMTDFLKQATTTLNPEPKEAPDALAPSVNYEFLTGKLAASKTTVKKLLTDQKVVRGIGNAYADEILWHARISPFSVSNKIPAAAIRRLAKSIRSVLEKAAKQILNSNPDIVGGEVREFMQIHHPDRTHSPTGAVIQVSRTGARKTYFTEEQERFE